MYRLKLKDSTSQFYFGPDASTKESYTFGITLRNLDDNTNATLNSTVAGSTQITVTVVTGNAPFVGQTVIVGGTNAIVTNVAGSVVTLNTSVSANAGVTLNFLAPTSTITKTAALSNNRI